MTTDSFFNNTLFRDQALNKLRDSNLQISNKGLKHFKETCLSVLNTGVMVRSKLRKKFLKSRSQKLQKSIQ